jgi:hypothetical protein
VLDLAAGIKLAPTNAGATSATDSSKRRFSSPRARTGWLKVISGVGKPAAWTR